MMKIKSIIAFIFFFFTSSIVYAYRIEDGVLSSGGMSSRSRSYVLEGTLSPIFGSSGWLSSRSYKAIIGFWHPYKRLGSEKANIEEVYSNLGNYRNMLYRASPNPAIDEVEIRYSIKNKGRVEIVVYNIIGQKVKTLVNKVQEPGEYKVVWDLGGISKESVPGGVYFYSMKTKGFKEIRKMIIIR